MYLYFELALMALGVYIKKMKQTNKNSLFIKKINRFVVHLQAPNNFIFSKNIPLRYFNVMNKIYACRIA